MGLAMFWARVLGIIVKMCGFSIFLKTMSYVSYVLINGSRLNLSPEFFAGLMIYCTVRTRTLWGVCIVFWQRGEAIDEILKNDETSLWQVNVSFCCKVYFQNFLFYICRFLGFPNFQSCLLGYSKFSSGFAGSSTS